MEKQRAHLGLSKPLKYPADDLALDLHRPLWVRSKLRLHKIPSYLMTDILMVFDFLRTFRYPSQNLMIAVMTLMVIRFSCCAAKP